MSEFKFDWSLTEDVNKAWELMWNYILNVCDKHSPFITFVARTKPDYITDEILTKMKKRDIAYRIVHRTKKPEDLTVISVLSVKNLLINLVYMFLIQLRGLTHSPDGNGRLTFLFPKQLNLLTKLILLRLQVFRR